MKIKLKVGNREISVVELPSPKQGTFYPTGLEHAEFVIEESFEDYGFVIKTDNIPVFELK